MNFLTDLFNEIDEQNKPATQEQEKPVDVKTKLLDFEKMIADAARSSGVQPRTYLEQLCTKNPKFAESKLVKSLLGIVETEQEHTYTVVHAKHGKEEIKASSSYGAAKKYAEMKKLKGTSGVDAHLHTKEEPAE